MSVSAINYTPPAAAGETVGSVRAPKKSLDQADFLKLLTTQLAKQDPMKPMEDTSFMAQMAQFTSLEQSSQMAKDMAALRSDFAQQSAYAMIGRDVTVTTDDGEVTGTVESVANSAAEGTQISVGGQLYSLSQVVRVAPPAPAVQPQS